MDPQRNSREPQSIYSICIYPTSLYHGNTLLPIKIFLDTNYHESFYGTFFFYVMHFDPSLISTNSNPLLVILPLRQRRRRPYLLCAFLRLQGVALFRNGDHQGREMTRITRTRQTLIITFSHLDTTKMVLLPGTEIMNLALYQWESISICRMWLVFSAREAVQ